MTPSTPSPDSHGRRCRLCCADWRPTRLTTPGSTDFAPEACLINRYVPGAKLSLHQDKDELDFAAPIVSVSLGLPAIFLFGGQSAPTSRTVTGWSMATSWSGAARRGCSFTA